MPPVSSPPAEPASIQRPASVLGEVIFLALATVLCLAPLVDKALETDDTLFVRAAQHIQNRPLDYYGFDVHWSLSPTPMHVETKNPPLACYYLAAAGTLFGWSERALHLAMLVPAVLAVWGAYAVARQCEAPPVWSAFATLGTPVFLVSASMLMCDVWMLAFWLCAAAAWLRGVDTDEARWLAVAAAAAGLALWTKYFAVALPPLLLVYAVRRRGLLWAGHLWLAVPVAMLAAYEWVNQRLYGASLLAEAARFALEVGPQVGVRASNVAKEPQTMPILERVWIGLMFAGGCCLPLAFYYLWQWRRAAWIVAAVGMALAALVLSNVEQVAGYWMWPNGRLDLSMYLHQIAFGAFGAALAVQAIWTVWRRRDAVTLLLSVWIVGTLVFAAVVNWTCNGRSVLPLVPAAAILALRELGLSEMSLRRRIAIAPVGAGVALSLLVALGGASLPNTDRVMVQALLGDYPPSAERAVWFLGHCGWQYYLEQGGARPIDFRRQDIPPTDVILIPEVNTFVVRDVEAMTRRVEIHNVPQSPWAATMSYARGAGFHTSVFGPLPYRLGPTAPLRYQVRRTRKTLTISSPKLLAAEPAPENASGQ